MAASNQLFLNLKPQKIYFWLSLQQFLEDLLPMGTLEDLVRTIILGLKIKHSGQFTVSFAFFHFAY